MRLAAQMQGGFYPASPEAVALAASLLRPPRGQPFSILDPCAGEGAALVQLSKILGCISANLFAIELDEGRAETLKAALPDARVLAPASFFGCRASFGSFSMIWLNPPFDDAYSGRRVEETFLQVATPLLLPGGVLALVCPEDVIDEHGDARRHLLTYYEHCTLVPFPARCRAFKEVIVLGHKRLRPMAAAGERQRHAWEAVQAPPGFLYQLPPGPGPRTFQKIEPTEPELQRILLQSPLRSQLAAPRPAPLPSPPLALGIGHVALLLASGHLDGVVQPDGQPPHVVRGTARKRTFVADVCETENDDGSTTTRTTLSERIDLVVRTVDLSGTLRTFADPGAGTEPE